MNKKIGLLAVIMLILAFNIIPVLAQPCVPVEVTKTTSCERTPDFQTTDPLYFELNGEKIYSGDPLWGEQDLGAIPVYPMGTELEFWMKINVKANVDLTDVVVYDRLGGELKITGIAFDSSDSIPDYSFDYSPYARDGAVAVAGPAPTSGALDKDGVTINDPTNGKVTVYWTGNSVKAHLKWEAGDIDEGKEKAIWIIAKTDTNPAGKQEYTSPGTYMLNSGATVKALLASTGKQVSNRSEQIIIKVIDD